jgi:Ser/Thr protein kinase RdoA (MazF antagonist)
MISEHTLAEEASVAEFLRRTYAATDRPELRISILPGGMDNLNFHVDAGEGGAYVLRRFRLSAAEEVKEEIRLIKNLVQLEYPTPRMHRNRDNEFLSDWNGYPHVLFDFVETARFAAREDLEAVTDLIHRLHVLTQGFSGPSERRKFSQLEERFRARCRQPAAEAPVREMLGILEGWRRKQGPELASLLPSLRRCRVHYDLNPGNLLIDRAGKINLIDFDESIFGPAVLDLASLFHYWCLSEDGSAFDMALAARILASYENRSPLGKAERRSLPFVLLKYQIDDCLNYYLGHKEGEEGFDLSESYSFQGLKLILRLCEGKEIDFQ